MKIKTTTKLKAFVILMSIVIWGVRTIKATEVKIEISRKED